MRPTASRRRCHRICSGSLVILVALVALAAGCARPGAGGTLYSATAMAGPEPGTPAELARRQAIERAETKARDQLVRVAQQIKTADGRSLEEVAVLDPFVQAKIMDTVRSAPVVDRTVDDQGIVTVTLRIDLTPLNKLAENYNQPTPAQ